jgi:hypothetical protein
MISLFKRYGGVDCFSANASFTGCHKGRGFCGSFFSQNP